MSATEGIDSTARNSHRSDRLMGKISPWRARNWRLRTKMTVVLLVPSFTALAFSGLRVQSELADAGDFNRIVDQVDVSWQVTEVVHQLQDERAVVAAGVAAGDKKLLESQRVRELFGRTNEAIAVLRQRVGGLDLPDVERRSRYEHAISRLDQLDPLRMLAGGAVYPDLAVLSAYTSVIDPLVQLGREVAAAGDTSAAPSRLSAVVQSLGQAKERAAQLDALLLVSAAHNTFRASSVQNQAQSAAADFEASIADFFAVATPDEEQAYRDGYSGADVDRRGAIAQTALHSSEPTAPLGIDSAVLNRTSELANDKLRVVEQQFIVALRSQASALAGDATRAAWLATAIVVVAMILALLLVLRIARSLLRPLRLLRREALEVANTKLPETIERILADVNPVEAAKNAVAPVPVFTKEEIGQVARSFDAVHDQAVRLAAEQAVLRDNINDMMVNLARRSQTLVERQLSELDALEQNEQDPDQLSRFFVLDHLATRLRRNSENLLILSGSGLVRRASQPVPIAEVINATLSEVEQYTRVTVRSVPDLLVQGRVVKDLVHLIAELVDNATKFSPSDTTVTVTSGLTRDGKLAVQISDEGLGMSDEELAKLNERLANPPPFDLSVSRRMGLYVVARLAKQHNIRVRLHGDLDGGTLAVVALPLEFSVKPSQVTTPATVTLPSAAEQSVTTPLNGNDHSAPRQPVCTNGVPAQRGPGSRWFKRTPVGQYADGATSPPHGSSPSELGAWSTADSGWEAVSGRLGDTSTQATVTANGLPKRMPQARLIPGSVPQPPEPQQPSEPSPSEPHRMAGAVRTRLAAFQQGLSRARHDPAPHREER